MAGKTLRGIGEDESGEHEVAADESDSARHTDKSAPSRVTDRLPLSTLYSGPTIDYSAPVFSSPVDEDKVAEGLKKLRSLDEPLGSIPGSMPTLRDGVPVVTDGPTTPAPAAAARPALSAAELIRSHGTALGHALSVPGAGQGLATVGLDDRLRGTIMGHSLHLPDLPEPAGDGRSAEVRSIALIDPAAPVASETDGSADFSHGDSSFFDSQPVNDELEPEAQSRGTMVARGAVVVAIISIFVVAAVAWVKVHKGSDVANEAQPVRVLDPVVVPNAQDNTAAPAPPVVPPETTSAVPAAAAPPTGPAAAPAPSGVPAPEGSPAVEDALAFPTNPPGRRPHEANGEPGSRPARPSTTHSPRPPESHHAAALPRPAGSGKPAKTLDDPDGTLPLTE